MKIREVQDAIAPKEPFSIEVVVGRRGDLMWDSTMQAHERVVAQIKRHVDDVESVVLQTKRVCKHCGGDPEFEDDGPACCDPAQAEWEALRKS